MALMPCQDIRTADFSIPFLVSGEIHAKVVPFVAGPALPEEQVRQKILDEFFFRYTVEAEVTVSPFPELARVFALVHGKEIMVIAGIGFQSMDILLQLTQVPDAVASGVDIVGLDQSACFLENLLLDRDEIIIVLFHMASPCEMQ
jgi:hypothetical protein